jgi:hypothetical protein
LWVAVVRLVEAQRVAKLAVRLAAQRAVRVVAQLAAKLAVVVFPIYAPG